MMLNARLKLTGLMRINPRFKMLEEIDQNRESEAWRKFMPTSMPSIATENANKKELPMEISKHEISDSQS